MTLLTGQNQTLFNCHKNPHKDLYLGPPDFDGYLGLPDFEGFKVII